MRAVATQVRDGRPHQTGVCETPLHSKQYLNGVARYQGQLQEQLKAMKAELEF